MINVEGQFNNQPLQMTSYEYSIPTTICTGNTSSTPVTSPFGVDSEVAVYSFQSADTAGLVQLNFDRNPMLASVPQTPVTGTDGMQFRAPLTMTPDLYWLPVKDAVFLTASAFTGTFTLILVWRRAAQMSVPSFGIDRNWGDLTS